MGKPEPLRGDLPGWRSSRVDGINRIMLQIIDDRLAIYSCKGHCGT
ncbi:MAG: type II toxin-antitoxin system YoeB family toxin [Synergistaceae bacterium]|nr:type II toxin-antitoxin system YoeB family toxin [Synergistaceae bacterium]